MITAISATTSTWSIDPTHSIAEFAIKNLFVKTVKGRFRELEGAIRIDESQPENSSVEAQITVASVDSDVPKRDAHLRSDDFFSAEDFPYITFRSTHLERLNGKGFKLTGDLTIRDMTREVILAGEYEGQVDDPEAGHRSAFTATAQISRKEFNFYCGQRLGRVLVGDNVKVTLHIEAIRQG